jgi:hypothetical protein
MTEFTARSTSAVTSWRGKVDVVAHLKVEVCHIEMLENYRRLFPDDKSAKNLEYWKIFEQKNPDCFRGMYQFLCHKMS